MKKLLLLLFCFVLLSGCTQNLDRTNPLDPNSPNFTGGLSISGRVLDLNLQPMPNVVISTVPATTGVVSTNLGNYSILNLIPGTYIVKASAPYCTDFTSSQVVVSTKAVTFDINMNPNILIADNLEAYGTGITIPFPPWSNGNINGASSMIVTDNTKVCKMVGGTAAGDNAKIYQSVPGMASYRMQCKMRTDTICSNAGTFKMQFKDASGVIMISEFGFGLGATLAPRYLTGAITEVVDSSTVLNPVTYYTFVMEADNGTNKASFYVLKDNVLIYSKKDITVWVGGPTAIGQITVFVAGDPATWSNCYVDDIKVIKK